MQTRKPAAKTITRKSVAASTDTTIKGATIEITQSYRPEVKNAPKPELSPSLPPVDTTTPAFNYEVPQQVLSYTYSSMPIRPLALGMDSANIPYPNYVKLGAGNLSTIYLDAGIGGLRGPDYETNFQLNHISQSGDIQHQKTSLTNFKADGTQHRSGHEWHAAFQVFRNQYYYYGYDHSAYNFTDDSIKQAYTGIRFGIDMHNEMEGFKGIDYHPSLSLSLYNDRFDGVENTFSLALPLSYQVDTSLRLHFGLSGVFTNYKKPFFTQNNNVLQLTPGVSFVKGNFKGRAGLYPTFGRSNTYLLPDLDARYRINGSQFTLLAGWHGRLRQNTFEELSTRNPYMYDRYVVRQTRNDELFGGVQTNIGNHLSFTGRLSYWRYKELPLFVNDTATDNKQFLIVYDDVSAVSLQGTVRYQVATTISVGAGLSWYGYSPENQRRVWHEPGLTLKADVSAKPIPELTLNAYISALDEIYALEKGNRAVKLDGVLDLGFSAEYSFISRLSAFIQLTNLLNNRYERWNGYAAYGFNAYGGLRLKF